MKAIYTILLALSAGFVHGADGAPPAVPALTPIASLDVPRYMGTWYEIAKYPNSFQKKCVADTRANYSQQPDGRVQVINRCRLADGEIDEAVGAVRQLGDAQSAKLEVRFAPAWLSFIAAVWGDYWVIDLDPAYQLVAVSEPKRDYLWVLSRTAKVAPAAYDALLERLANRGFDLKRLELSVQSD
ncbi:lipocalin family protein [Rhodoferax antarcticus]|uniref:lipocalin family protein n=1 Tax=Rhodoferax antarcticus TaxID=81479 RepID=UPI002224D538|nr:lipocalin family protein [Rhodoferax antarcticus]MCW2313723.1 apolipoprotein D and lipocalin family protein [Rhodoferax antarcticus]